MNSVMTRPLVRRLMQDPRLRLYFSGKPSNPAESLRDVLAPFACANVARASRPCAKDESPSRKDESLSKDDAYRGKASVPTTGKTPVPQEFSPTGKMPVPQLPGKIAPSWMVNWRAWDLFICPDIVMPARRARNRVELFHGVSFKGKAYTDKILRFNHVFIVGEYMRKRFEQKGLLVPDDPRAHRIGMPKTDPLLDGSLDRATLLAGQGLDPARPTVLYAPTWRPEASLNVEGEAIIDALAAINLNVLVKIHDHCRDPRTNRRDWGEWLDAREGGNVRQVRDADIIPSLHAADILVSDASSVGNEFTLLDRPILFMDVPKLLEVYGDTADLDTWGRNIGDIVKGASNLRAAVEQAMSDPTAKSEIRRAAAADIFYNPGHATDAAVKAIYEILNLE